MLRHLTRRHRCRLKQKALCPHIGPVPWRVPLLSMSGRRHGRLPQRRRPRRRRARRPAPAPATQTGALPMAARWVRPQRFAAAGRSTVPGDDATRTARHSSSMSPLRSTATVNSRTDGCTGGTRCSADGGAAASNRSCSCAAAASGGNAGGHVLRTTTEDMGSCRLVPPRSCHTASTSTGRPPPAPTLPVATPLPPAAPPLPRTVARSRRARSAATFASGRTYMARRSASTPATCCFSRGEKDTLLTKQHPM